MKTLPPPFRQVTVHTLSSILVSGHVQLKRPKMDKALAVLIEQQLAQ